MRSARVSLSDDWSRRCVGASGVCLPVATVHASAGSPSPRHVASASAAAPCPARPPLRRRPHSMSPASLSRAPHYTTVLSALLTARRWHNPARRPCPASFDVCSAISPNVHRKARGQPNACTVTHAWQGDAVCDPLWDDSSPKCNINSMHNGVWCVHVSRSPACAVSTYGPFRHVSELHSTRGAQLEQEGIRLQHSGLRVERWPVRLFGKHAAAVLGRFRAPGGGRRERPSTAEAGESPLVTMTTSLCTRKSNLEVDTHCGCVGGAGRRMHENLELSRLLLRTAGDLAMGNPCSPLVCLAATLSP